MSEIQEAGLNKPVQHRVKKVAQLLETGQTAVSAGYLSTLEVAQLINLLPEVAAELIPRGC